jgi:hypothetical protein
MVCIHWVWSSHDIYIFLGYRKSYGTLEVKYNDLLDAFKEKSKALADTQGKYQQLKSQAMMAEVQHAASEDAENALNLPNSFSGATRAGYIPRRSTSLPGRVQYSRQGPTRLPTTATQTGNTRMDRSAQPMHYSQNQIAPSRLSSHSSNDRMPLDHSMRYPQMQSTQKTRLPMPIGVSVGSQPQRNAPIRAGGYGFDNASLHQQQSSYIGLSRLSKRSRIRGIRTSDFM